MLHEAKIFCEPRVPAFTGNAIAFMPYSDEARDIQDWAYEQRHINPNFDTSERDLSGRRRTALEISMG